MYKCNNGMKLSQQLTLTGIHMAYYCKNQKKMSNCREHCCSQQNQTSLEQCFTYAKVGSDTRYILWNENTMNY